MSEPTPATIDALQQRADEDSLRAAMRSGSRWVELFAGAGGASEGIKAAGGEAVACIEIDPDACATLAAAGFPAMCADVRDWTEAIQLRQEFSRGSSVRVIDAVGMWASFPCQCWSNAGKRLGASDPRNGWPWTVAAIDAVRPQWFVAENVTGLAMHSEKECGNVELCPGCYLEGVILPQLRERFAWVDVWRLDAADFGVPQHRRRLFMVAGPHAARPPKPTHADPRKCLGLFVTLKPWVTFGEALGIRGIVGTGQITDIKGGGRGPHEVSTERPSPTVRVGGPRGGAVMYVTAGQNTDSGGKRAPYATTIDRPSPAVRTRGDQMFIVGGGRDASDSRSYRDLTNEPSTTVAAVQIGNAGPWVCDEKAREALLDKPAPTVTCGEGKGSTSNIESALKLRSAGDALHLATGRRRLTTDECAKLQGFPPGYPFQGTKTAVYRQIGNACPPALTEAVVRSIMAADTASTPGGHRHNTRETR